MHLVPKSPVALSLEIDGVTNLSSGSRSDILQVLLSVSRVRGRGIPSIRRVETLRLVLGNKRHGPTIMPDGVTDPLVTPFPMARSSR